MKLTREILDYLYKQFNKKEFADDPIKIVHYYKYDLDKEIFAFIASLYSYGNVKQIINTLQKVKLIMGSSPYDFVMNFKNFVNHNNVNLIHRFNTNKDFENLIRILKKILNEYSSLKNLFLSDYNPSDENIKYSLHKFVNALIDTGHKVTNGKLNDGLRFFFPDPIKNSSCKRLNLFLRWMVRKDKIDLGLWKEIDTSKLVIPLDTHIIKIARIFNLTKLTSPSWKMAEEITNSLKKFDQKDPVKYDFALMHISSRKDLDLIFKSIEGSKTHFIY